MKIIKTSQFNRSPNVETLLKEMLQENGISLEKAGFIAKEKIQEWEKYESLVIGNSMYYNDAVAIKGTNLHNRE